jgi:hypothetical protein
MREAHRHPLVFHRGSFARMTPGPP